MKTLLVMRHAKSSWSKPGLADFDRPLNERGKLAAPKMGEFIRDQGLIPQLIISSTAKRAKKTAEIFAESCGYDSSIEFESNFYLASPETYIEVLSWQQQSDPIMVIGHNPGLENLVYVLTGETEAMPTAAIAQIEISINDWSEIVSGRGEMRNLWRPKEL